MADETLEFEQEIFTLTDEDGNERQNYVLSTELPLAMKNKREK